MIELQMKFDSLGKLDSKQVNDIVADKDKASNNNNNNNNNQQLKLHIIFQKKKIYIIRNAKNL